MSKKDAKIEALIAGLQGQGTDAHYLGYFDCFNRQLFYEAHDVLEALWLPIRREPDGAFYKGLIQLAGAFVHLQKNRLRPAAALFKLARANFGNYPAVHQRLDIAATVNLIDTWLRELDAGGFLANPLHPERVPQLHLLHV